jgi:2-keto-4-pentenoate hydratase/2-oxohepta-3-ene-1,7-dioic acid hydratase in catechol pathway
MATIQQQLANAGLPPLSGNIYAIGRNYRDHAKELNNPVPTEPVVFLKAPSSLRPLQSGPLAFADEEFHHEAEIVLLLSDQATQQHDHRAIAAATLGIDLTRRPLQTRLKQAGLPWARAKSFQGSALIGAHWQPVEADQWSDGIDLRLEVNGELRQAGHTRDWLFPLATLLDFLAEHQPLTGGDLIFTGTPPGVGPLHRGDQLHLMSQALGLDEQGVL